MRWSFCENKANVPPQKGDLPAVISAEEQQKQTVEAIEAFLAQRTEG